MNKKSLLIKKFFKNIWLFFLFVPILLTGCGGKKAPKTAASPKQDKGTWEADEESLKLQKLPEDDGGMGESARDGGIDFGVLKAENPDIFAWIYIPGTEIDCPVLQSQEADDYYENHNVYRKADAEGAVYTELANLKDMCDFNTVIHGKAAFDDLLLFSDSAFFTEHDRIEIYLEDNVLVYTVFAAYERENTSLIRSYDFTYGTGCQEFLEDMYGLREMGKNIREGWEDVTPYHFLVTLTAHRDAKPDKQFVVLGALVSDGAGKIDRQVEW